MGVITSKKSVLSECRNKMLAFWHDLTTPRTPLGVNKAEASA